VISGRCHMQHVNQSAPQVGHNKNKGVDWKEDRHGQVQIVRGCTNETVSDSEVTVHT
jgi:hypothetical protein